MCREDEEKIAFVTDLGTFCFQVIPFDLKNAEVTFQRLMNKTFKNQIGKKCGSVCGRHPSKNPKKQKTIFKTFKKLSQV